MNRSDAIKQAIDDKAIGDEFTVSDIFDEMLPQFQRNGLSLYNAIGAVLRARRTAGEVAVIGKRRVGTGDAYVYQKTQVQHDRAVEAILQPSMAVLVALGSIAVHVEEYLSPDGHPNDKIAIDSLLRDANVREFLDRLDQLAFLPKKRK